MPVVDRSGSKSRSAVSVAIFAATLMALFAEQAFAQGLFDLFSNARRELAAPALSYAPAAPAAASPSIERPLLSNGTGHSVNYCVRLCDGRYFPIQRHAAVSPAQLCDALVSVEPNQDFLGSRRGARGRHRWCALREPAKCIPVPQAVGAGLYLQRQRLLRACEDRPEGRSDITPGRRPCHGGRSNRRH